MVDHLSCRCDVLQHSSVLGFAKVTLDLIDTAVDPGPVLFSPTTLTHDLGQVHANHQRAQTLAGPRQGIALGGHDAGFKEDSLKAVEHLPAAKRPVLAARSLCASCVGHAGKGLRVGIAPLPQGFTLASQEEEHTPGFIEAVALQELHAGKRPNQPFLPLLHRVVEGCEHPSASPLNPHGLVRIDQCPIAVKGREQSALFPIESMLQPERQSAALELCPALLYLEL